ACPAGTDLASGSEEPSRRYLWKSILASMLALAAVYAGRGWLLARLVCGTHRLHVLVFDLLILALLILSRLLLDLGIKKSSCWNVGTDTPTRKALAAVVNWSLVCLIAVPFLIALVQFHPQKIGCGLTPGEIGLPYTNVALESEGLHLSG